MQSSPWMIRSALAYAIMHDSTASTTERMSSGLGASITKYRRLRRDSCLATALNASSCALNTKPDASKAVKAHRNFLLFDLVTKDLSRRGQSRMVGRDVGVELDQRGLSSKPA